MPLSIAQLQTNVATSQANLQAANINMARSSTVLNDAITSGDSATIIDQANHEFIIASEVQQHAQTTLNNDQSALDVAVTAAQIAQTSIPSTPSNVAPENDQAPQATDPHNGETTTDYSSASADQLTSEAAMKVAQTGLTRNLTSLTQGIKIQNVNGAATAINTATGQTYANLGEIDPIGNTLPPNSLISSPADKTNTLKVTISQAPRLSGDLAERLTNNQIILNVMPSISETRDANYKSFTPIQHPGEILKYDGSSSRQWGITAKLVCRSRAEADLNLAYINLIRSWVMPFYGSGTGTADTQTAQYLGAPPPILTLKAYGNRMIGPVPCVLMQYQTTWPNDVDYISTSDGNPFPVSIDISLNLKESYSPAEYSGFNLMHYRNGNLSTSFTAAPPSKSATQQVAGNPTEVSTSSASNITQQQVNSANSSAQSTGNSANADSSAQLTAAQTSAGRAISRFTSGGSFSAGRRGR